MVEAAIEKLLVSASANVDMCIAQAVVGVKSLMSGSLGSGGNARLDIHMESTALTSSAAGVADLAWSSWLKTGKL